MAKNYHQGKFIPRHPEKYIGDVNNVVYRSSWERKLMKFFDETPGIQKWTSEEFIVPYISPVDGMPHRYFVDFGVIFKTRSGEIKKALVEVKPATQMAPPKQKSKRTKQFLQEIETFAVNQAKWEAAKAFANKQGMEFWVLNEYDLGIK